MSVFTHNKRGHGFTLIEVQIGLLLLILIIGLVYSALHLATKSTQKSAKATDITEELRLVSHFMQKQVAQIHPLYWVDRRGTKPIFRGDKESFVFTAPLVASGEPDLLYLQKFAFVKSDQSDMLEFGSRAFDFTRSPDKQEQEMNNMSLLKELKSVRFEYFGINDSRGGQAGWHNKWTSKKNLPWLIKCEIKTAQGPQWPELFMPIRTNNTSSLNQFKINAPNSNTTRTRSADANTGDSTVDKEEVNDAD